MCRQPTARYIVRSLPNNADLPPATYPSPSNGYSNLAVPSMPRADPTASYMSAHASCHRPSPEKCSPGVQRPNTALLIESAHCTVLNSGRQFLETVHSTPKRFLVAACAVTASCLLGGCATGVEPVSHGSSEASG